MCYSGSIVRLMAAEATRALLAPLGIQRILLVTSAFLFLARDAYGIKHSELWPG